MTDISVQSAPSEGAAPETDRGGAFGVKGIAWVVFEFARNPYYNLIVVYIFAAYFATEVAGGGDVGFGRLALVGTIAGLFAAPTSPILGAIADQTGRRKPAIALFIAILAGCSTLLWFAKPAGQGGLGLYPTMAVMVIGYAAYTYSETLHNAMLPSAARPSAVPLLSGMALASANLASVGMFIVFVLFMAGPDAAAFGLDKTAGEHNRIVGPFIAIWMIVFMVPFFLYMPDAPGRGVSWRRATRTFLFGAEGAGQTAIDRLKVFGVYLSELFRQEPNTMRFLVARTIYADGMHALLVLGAGYVVTFLNWSEIELGIYAIFGLLFGAIGGLVGGWLDRAFGCRRALMIEIAAVVLIAAVQLSITGDSILYGLVAADQPVWDAPVFSTLSDVVYVASIIPGAIFVVAVIASSRSMLVHVAPEARIGEFFGLYAIAGTVTVWMGPLLVTILTSISGSQRVGMAGIGLLFFVGLAILTTVKASKTTR